MSQAVAAQETIKSYSMDAVNDLHNEHIAITVLYCKFDYIVLWHQSLSVVTCMHVHQYVHTVHVLYCMKEAPSHAVAVSNRQWNTLTHTATTT